MSVELSPRGTHGFQMNGLARSTAKAMWRLGDVLFRLRGGRLKIQGQPLLRLTTAGAKTGRRRNSVLTWFPDGDRADSWLVVGSNAGDVRHPGWCYNLAKNPHRVWAEVGGRRLQVTPTSLSGPERERAWNEVVEKSPMYGRYAAKTDRVIPIIRLTPSA